MSFFSNLWTGVKTRLIGSLLVLDEEGNVLIGQSATVPAAGNAHYTISERLAEMRERGSKVGCIGCKILTWIQNHWPFNVAGDHCTLAMDGMPESIDSMGMTNGAKLLKKTFKIKTRPQA